MESESDIKGSDAVENNFKVVDLQHLDDPVEKLSNSFSIDASLPQCRHGGWGCGILLLVNQGLVTLAFAGVEVNLVLFSKSVLRQTNADAANTFSRWIGTTNFFSLLGALLSDSYLGSYLTCVVFHSLFILGLVALSLATHFFLLKPDGCGKIGTICEPHGQLEVAIFYVSIYLIALGNGAAEPALATLGADQFGEEEESPEKDESTTSFYCYFYLSVNLGCLVAETVVVYVENMGHWMIAFWICASCGAFAYLSLLSGTTKYRLSNPSGNPISRFSQVIVASIRKSNLQLPSNGEELYDAHGGQDEGSRLKRLLHTNSFKFLDQAAILTSEERCLMINQTPNPWKLCPISQIEEVKSMLRLIPIWLCTIFSSVVFIQMLSLFVEQGAAMDTKISNFNIPPASMTAFDIISTSMFIMLYDKLIVPLYVKLTKRKPNPPGELQRIGTGLAIAIVALLVAGFVEQKRVKHATESVKETSSLSIFWQTPQYVLVGVSEAFVYVAQMEFFASNTPEGLKTLGMALSMSSSAMGSFIASGILSVVMDITTSKGRPGWVPPNLNQGHLDKFFFLSAGLTAINLGFYIICAKNYQKISVKNKEESRDMEPGASSNKSHQPSKFTSSEINKL